MIDIIKKYHTGKSNFMGIILPSSAQEYYKTQQRYISDTLECSHTVDPFGDEIHFSLNTRGSLKPTVTPDTIELMLQTSINSLIQELFQKRMTYNTVLGNKIINKTKIPTIYAQMPNVIPFQQKFNTQLAQYFNFPDKYRLDPFHCSIFASPYLNTVEAQKLNTVSAHIRKTIMPTLLQILHQSKNIEIHWRIPQSQ